MSGEAVADSRIYPRLTIEFDSLHVIIVLFLKFYAFLSTFLELKQLLEIKWIRVGSKPLNIRTEE